MAETVSEYSRILITGGTSGLGLALAKYFLISGYEVVITGRNKVIIEGYGDKFTFIRTDFSNLAQTSEALNQICEILKFDIVINNAGILSPPEFHVTDDGLEYTFQVNFLSHLLLNEIILKYAIPGRPAKIIAVVSPAYRIAEKDLDIYTSKKKYRAFKAYSNSKLYLALMCSYLPVKHSSLNLKCIGFDPGVFNSGIYRMQKEWFRFLYGIAAPFMRNPERIARRFHDVVRTEDILNGAIYRYSKKIENLPLMNNRAADIFWQECYSLIEPFLK